MRAHTQTHTFQIIQQVGRNVGIAEVPALAPNSASHHIGFCVMSALCKNRFGNMHNTMVLTGRG